MNSLEGLEAMAAEATTKVDELLGDGWTCCITVNDGFKYFMFGGYLQNKFGRVVVRKKAINKRNRDPDMLCVG